MFLNQLNEKEKNAFISLGVHAARANSVVDINERNMIRGYCREMDIVFFDTKDILPMSEIVEVYSNADQSTKRIVLLEILGLLYVDGCYDEQEEKFLKEFVEKIGLTKEDIEIQTVLLKKYLDILNEMTVSINL